MQRKLDLWMTASSYKLELEDILSTLAELIEAGTQHGIIDKENNQFYHITEIEQNNFISLLSKDRVLIKDIAQELEIPLNAFKEWLQMLVKANKLNGSLNLVCRLRVFCNDEKIRKIKLFMTIFFSKKHEDKECNDYACNN